MSINHLKFQELNVRRAPGFSAGMQSLKPMDSDVVVISGPNGSGKSTTARILRETYRPERNSSYEFECTFTVNSQQWTLFKTAGQIRWTCNGEQAEPDFLPASTLDSRYMLAMHDLLLSEDSDLADILYRASVGGFNIELASRKLGYAGVGKNQTTPEFKTYKEREEAVENAQTHQAEVKERQGKLSLLEGKKQHSNRADIEKRAYELLRQRQACKMDVDEAEALLHGFPPRLDRLSSDDADRYAAYVERIADLKQQIAQSDAANEDLLARIKALDVPEGTQLTEDLTLIKAIQQEYSKKSDEAERLKSQVDELRSNIGKSHRFIGTISLDNNYLTNNKLDNLEDIYRKLLAVGERVAIQKETVDMLRGNLDNLKDIPASDVIQRGVIALTGWLREGRSEVKYVATNWLFLLATLTVLAAAAGWYFGAGGVLVALVVSVLFLLAARSGWLSDKNQTSAELRKNDFRQTGLNEPQVWNESEVTNRLNELVNMLQQSANNKILADRLDTALTAYKTMSQEVQTVEDEFNSLAEAIGVDSNRFSGSGAMYEFMRHYVSLQQSLVQLAGKEGQLNAILNDIAELTNQIETLASRYKKTFPNRDKIQVLGVLDVISDSISDFRSSSQNLRVQQSGTQLLKNELAQKEKELLDLLNRLSLNADEGHFIADLVARKPEYTSILQDRDAARVQSDRIEQQLRMHPFFEKLPENCFDLSVNEIDDIISSLETVAGELEGINIEIGAIGREVDNLLSGHNLETALTHLDNARNTLQLSYQTKVRSVIGDVITQELKQEAGNTSVPEVMRKARHFFARITGGRYELQLTNDTGFKAYDTSTGQYRILDELSSGTRIQLLLAVRLAFVEVQEQGVRLPIFADELLANSDDVRAEAVIDTLLEIAKAGRQVIYFTAQSDEINKWMHKFGGEVSHAQISLDRSQHPVSSPSEKRTVPLLSRSLPDPSLPFEQYLAQLNIPRVDPIFGDVRNIHVAFLCNDVPTLHNLLEMHIDTWSQLETLYQNRSLPDVLKEQQIQDMQRKINMLKEASRLMQIGRNTPVGIAELIASDAVSDKFIDEVLDVLGKKCDNDPARLVTALESRAVNNFRNNSIDKLKSYFSTEALITDEKPLSEDEFRSEMSSWLNRQGIPQTEFDAIMKRIL